MDRLTKPPHSIVLPVSTLSESVDKVSQIYCKLWEYENTELSPSEVAALKAENAELKNRLKIAARALEMAVTVATEELKNAPNYKELYAKHIEWYIKMAGHEFAKKERKNESL